MTAADHLASAYAALHPAEVAQLLSTAEPAHTAEWLASMPALDAAGLIERVAPVTAGAALQELPTAAAAAIMAALEPRVAAALVRRLPRETADAMVRALPGDAAEHVTAMAAYGPAQAGARMDPRAPAVAPESSVDEVLRVVRAAPTGVLNYVYVVERQRLVGVVSMRELMLASATDRVADIMIRDPYSIAADDPLIAVLRHPGWRRAHAMPVVDRDGRFLGVIRHSQYRALEAELSAGGGDGSGSPDTARSLAELFWIGSSALGRLGEVALFGAHRRDPEDTP